MLKVTATVGNLAMTVGDTLYRFLAPMTPALFS
jgi:hypothetical protein